MITNKISSDIAGAKHNDGTAEIVSHPRQLQGGIAHQQHLGMRLAEHQKEAIKHIETVVGAAQAIKSDDNRSFVDGIVNEFRMVLDEIRSLNPLQLPDPEKFAGLAKRLEKTAVVLMYGTATESLRRIGGR